MYRQGKSKFRYLYCLRPVTPLGVAPPPRDPPHFKWRRRRFVVLFDGACSAVGDLLVSLGECLLHVQVAPALGPAEPPRGPIFHWKF